MPASSCPQTRTILVIWESSVSARTLASCAPKGNIGDYIPQWAGGPPKNLPPRPGTPEYDEFKRRLDVEAARDKSNDPPSQKPTDCAGGACPQR
jgi:hypothetical protein